MTFELIHYALLLLLSIIALIFGIGMTRVALQYPPEEPPIDWSHYLVTAALLFCAGLGSYPCLQILQLLGVWK